jgi:hypothetical protein
MEQINFSEGKTYIIDADFANGGEVELVEILSELTCMVKDLETGSTWLTLQSRLSEITTKSKIMKLYYRVPHTGNEFRVCNEVTDEVVAIFFDQQYAIEYVNFKNGQLLA